MLFFFPGIESIPMPVGSAQPAPALRPAGRIIELDTLRAAAILAVMAYHEVSFRLLHPWTVNGWIGVDLFFVLSGFLITGILLRSKSRPHYFSRFYGRRLLRIFPPYYAFLTLTLIVTLLLPGWRQPASLWAEYYLYLPSLIAPWSHAIQHMPVRLWMTLNVCWSLSVEEFFYMIWAPAVRWLDRRSLLVLVLAMICLAPVTRVLVHRPGHPEYFFFPARMDSLAWGALLALLLERMHSLRRASAALAAATAGCAAIFLQTHGNLDSMLFVVCGYSLLGLTFALLLLNVLLLSSHHPIRRAMQNRVTVWIGMTSYTTYLIHHPVQLIVEAAARRLPGHGSVSHAAILVLSFGAAFALSGLSWAFFEQPILQYKDRWFGLRPAAR